MKIVVLDGFALNPGDLSWDAVKALGDVTIYDRTAPDEVLSRAQGAQALLTNKTLLPATLINQLPDLKYIGVMATGYNVVDTKAAAQNGIIVTNVPAYSTDSVAQMVFAHILNITNQVRFHADEVRAGKWCRCADFTFSDTPQIEIAGKTIGLVGLGHTGMAVAKIALAFGMNVLAVTSKKQDALPSGITPVSYDRLFGESDIISLHCPLTPDTHELINSGSIGKMKPTAILINTGRGPLICEKDLADALNSGRIYAAGLDVLSVEPPTPDNPLLSATNCYITPHIAWATHEARQRLMTVVAQNLHDFIQGDDLHNVVI